MKFIIILIVIIISIPCLPMNLSYNLLSKWDYEIERENQFIPALSSSDEEQDYWESYNEWQCFALAKVDFECANIGNDDYRFIPVISVYEGNKLLEFDLGTEYNWDCKKVLSEWRELFTNSNSFCIFGAYLQDLDEDNSFTRSLWYIERIKTENGYWEMENYKDYITLSSSNLDTQQR